jgi:arsenite methyltransferase
MNDTNTDQEIKVCCATSYQSDAVRMLLGDVLHPGGLALTQQLGESIGLGPHDRILDIACGRGMSAMHLAHHFGCHVTGLDFGPENIAAAEAEAADRGLVHLTDFRQGDAEEIPFEDGTFDAVISECSFCTFLAKATAAAEMARVLRLGGRLGLTDVTVSGPLPDDILSLLTWVACVAGAAPSEDYVAILQGAGFVECAVEDHRDALLDMVHEVRRMLLGLELATGFGRLRGSAELEGALDGLDLGEAKRVALRVVELAETGLLGYTLIAARRA